MQAQTNIGMKGHYRLRTSQRKVSKDASMYVRLGTAAMNHGAQARRLPTYSNTLLSRKKPMPTMMPANIAVVMMPERK